MGKFLIGKQNISRVPIGCQAMAHFFMEVPSIMTNFPLCAGDYVYLNPLKF